MRLTNNMLIRKYVTNLNTSLANLDQLNGQVTSGQRISKASDDPAGALQALQVRRRLSRITQYQDNLRDAESWLTETETAISTIRELVTQAYERTLQGKNGTTSSGDRKIVAQNLRDIQSQMLSVANTNFNGRFILGGANTKEAPFTLDSSGKLFYNGQDLDNSVINNQDIFYDMGLGLKLVSGEVMPESAFTISNNGAEILGSGVGADGLSNNVYNLIGIIAERFEANDLTSIDQYMEKLMQKSDDIMVETVNIGERSNFVNFLKDRYDSAEFNAQKKQTALEGIDSARAIIDFKTQEAAYRAALQMGTRIIQPSLMDFLR